MDRKQLSEGLQVALAAVAKPESELRASCHCQDFLSMQLEDTCTRAFLVVLQHSFCGGKHKAPSVEPVVQYCIHPEKYFYRSYVKRSCPVL